MARLGGLRSSKKRVLAGMVNLLYPAPVWCDAMWVRTYAREFGRVQRTAAIRVCCVYRTLSTEAVLVVASMVPIGELLEERWRLALRQRKERNSSEERRWTVARWQRAWNEAEKC